MIDPVHREVLTWLKASYGIDATLERGGRHPRIVFTYRGKTVKHTVGNRHRATDVVAIATQTKQQLRRLLGTEPSAPPAPQRRNLEEMTAALNRTASSLATVAPEASPAPVLTADAVVGHYHVAGVLAPKSKVFIGIDAATYAALDWDRGLSVELVDDAFVVRQRADGKTTPSFGPASPSEDGVGFAYRCSVELPERLDLPVFGRSPATATVRPGTGTLEVRFDRFVLRPARRRGGRPFEVPSAVATPGGEPAPDREAAPPPPKPEPVPAALGAGFSPADLTAFLETLRRIEAETPYRLKRVDVPGAPAGREWVFTAPVIR